MQKSSDGDNPSLTEEEFNSKVRSFQNRPSAKVIIRHQEEKMNSVQTQQRSNSEYVSLNSLN